MADSGLQAGGPPPLPDWVVPWLAVTPWPTAVVDVAGVVRAASDRFAAAAAAAGLTDEVLAREIAGRAAPSSTAPAWLRVGAGRRSCAVWSLPHEPGDVHGAPAPTPGQPWLVLELRDPPRAGLHADRLSPRPTTTALHREIAQRALLHALREEALGDAARDALAAAERREAELAAVIDSMPDAVYLGTATGPLRANRAARTLLGDAAFAAASGPWGDAASVPALDAWPAVFVRALRGETVVREVLLPAPETAPETGPETAPVLPPDAPGAARPMATRVVRCAAAPVLIGGEVVAAVAVLTDLTAARRMEARLHEAQQFAGIGRLAGGVAHEFNNLLTVVGGNAEAAAESLAPSHPVQEDLAAIRHAVRRAAALTRQLLAYGRQQARRPEALDVASVARDAQRMMARLFDVRVAVSLRVGSSLPAVLADRGQLEQVLLNLALNARDAMPDGGTATLHAFAVSALPPDVVAADAEAPAPPAGWVALALEDTGTGMDDAVRARVFEPFFTTKPIGQGTGLGLAMVYGIVAQSGGALGLASAPGAGTTITVYLPALAVRPADDPGRAAPPRAVALAGDADASPTAGIGRGRCILLVDDEPAVRRTMARTLVAEGFEVVEAGSGEEALARVAERAGATGQGPAPAPIVALVTDVAMPGMQGPELAERLVAADPALRVLLVSGHAAPTGAPAWLEKPFGTTEFRAAVRALLDPTPGGDPG